MKRLSIVLVVFVVGSIAAFVIVGRMLVSPMQCEIGPPPVDLNAQPVRFANDLGKTIHGWWCPTANCQGTVLLLPGIRANRLSMLPRARFLRRAGYSTLMIDFEATGETKGEHITLGRNESHDVLAAVGFIRKTRSSDSITIIGSSLGGAAALLATPSLRVDGLVLESVYPTIEIAARNRLRKYLGPIGQSCTPLLLMQLRTQLGITANDLRPLDHIAYASCPVFVVNGENDQNTTVKDAMALYDAAKDPKQLWLVPNAGHVDLCSAATLEYERRILSFLGQNRAARTATISSD